MPRRSAVCRVSLTTFPGAGTLRTRPAGIGFSEQWAIPRKCPSRRLFQAWARDIAHYFARRAALKQLGELNDRELHDIGLTRGEVEAAVYGFISRPDRGRLS